MARLRYPFRRSWRWKLVECADSILDHFASKNHSIDFPESVQRILVVRLDHIGDVVCSLPVFGILKKRFPAARMTALVGSEGEAILKHHSDVDEVIVFRQNWFSRSGGVDGEELFRVLSLLRDRSYDVGYDLRGDLKSVWHV